jgi:hypothetical protein
VIVQVKWSWMTLPSASRTPLQVQKSETPVTLIE